MGAQEEEAAGKFQPANFPSPELSDVSNIMYLCATSNDRNPENTQIRNCAISQENGGGKVVVPIKMKQEQHLLWCQFKADTLKRITKC